MKNIVYLIEQLNTNKYKIGVSSEKSLLNRVRCIQTGCSEEVMVIKKINTNYATVIEKRLHALFNNKKTHGEWFTLNREDISLFEIKCLEYDRMFNDLIKGDNEFIIRRFTKTK